MTRYILINKAQEYVKLHVRDSVARCEIHSYEIFQSISTEHRSNVRHNTLESRSTRDPTVGCHRDVMKEPVVYTKADLD